MKFFRLSLWIFAICASLLTSCGRGVDARKYTIGIDPSWYHLDAKGREKNISLFSNELLQEISHLEHLHLSSTKRNWDNLLSGLDEEKYEAILSYMPPLLSYEKKYDFSSLYLSTGPVLVLPINAKETSLSNLSGKEIAVIKGSSAELIVEKYPEILIRTYESIPAAFNDLLKGTIDGAVVDYLNALAYTEDIYTGQIKIVSPPLNDEGLRLVTLHEKAPELIQAFNEGLSHMQKSGKYSALAKKWNL